MPPAGPRPICETNERALIRTLAGLRYEVGHGRSAWRLTWRLRRVRWLGLRRGCDSFVFAFDWLMTFAGGFHGMQRIEKAKDVLFKIPWQVRIPFDFLF
jgi:hypothetical protein